MQEKRIELNEVELQVRDSNSSGQAIIFLHFSGANLMMWQEALRYFQDGYRLVLVDLRGHGKSSQPESGYDMDTMAQDIAGLLDKLNITRAHVIGSSMGAEVGLSLAAYYPDKVLSLVCDGAHSNECDPYGSWEGTQAQYDAHVQHQLEELHANPEAEYASIDALLAKTRSSLEGIGWWNEAVEAMERYGACRLDNGMYVKAFRKFAREDYFKHYFSYRLEEYYSRVHCPLLVIASDEVLRYEAERVAMLGLNKLASNARLAELTGWQHPYGWMLDPEKACSAIVGFLDEVKAG